MFWPGHRIGTAFAYAVAENVFVGLPEATDRHYARGAKLCSRERLAQSTRAQLRTL